MMIGKDKEVNGEDIPCKLLLSAGKYHITERCPLKDFP